ncbi:MAG: class F sortase, partial [Baekduiaceae bacterium]
AAQDDRVTPTSVALPRLGIRAPIASAGIDLQTGALGVPKNIDRVGWWRDGAAPGATAGTILLAGHVDSAKRGAGAFYALKSARRGDTIELRSDDGKTRRWRVSSLQRVRKSALPERIFTRAGERRLVLVTCGGPFNEATGHYRDNIVVTATPA